MNQQDALFSINLLQ